jgi:hypothetical protein
MVVRPITPEDADGLVEFHTTLSDEAIYLRYFSAHPRLSLIVALLTYPWVTSSNACAS